MTHRNIARRLARLEATAPPPPRRLEVRIFRPDAEPPRVHAFDVPAGDGPRPETPTYGRP